MESLLACFFRIEVLLVNLKIIATENYSPILLIAPAWVYKYADHAVISRLTEKVDDDTVASNPFECDSLMNETVQLSLQFFECHSFGVIQTSVIPLQFIVDQIFIAVTLPYHLNLASIFNNHRGRKRTAIVGRHLRHRVRAGVEHCDHFADLDVRRKQPAVWQTPFAV